ncbi:MAG: DUF4132 domain-containing protein [Lewinellaceae bacterium]|nr:DUF4132 domain-containing protein [Lewinellaceae bacterium]
MKALLRKLGLVSAEPEPRQQQRTASPEEKLLHRLRTEVGRQVNTPFITVDLSNLEAYEAVKAAENDVKKALLLLLIKRWGQDASFNPYAGRDHLEWMLFSSVLRSRLNYTGEELATLLRLLHQHKLLQQYGFPYDTLLRQARNCIEAHGLEAALESAIAAVMPPFHPHWESAQERKFKRGLRSLAHLPEGKEILENTDALGRAVNDFLMGLNEKSYAFWAELVNHLVGLDKGSRPSNKWMEEGKLILGKFDAGALRAQFAEWLAGAAMELGMLLKENRHAVLWSPKNEAFLRNLIWLSPQLGDENLNLGIVKFGLLSLRKISGHGPYSLKLGNACAYAFRLLPFQDGVRHLSTFKAKVKHKTFLKQVDRLLAEVAEEAGRPVTEIEEVAVPTLGLNAAHELHREIGAYQAVLRVRRSNAVELVWRRPDGKEQKSTPKTIQEEFAGELKELRQVAKEAKALLPVQQLRIEQLFLRRQDWRFEDWFPYYAGHPVVGVIAARLIWAFSRNGEEWAPAFYHNGSWVDNRGKKIDWITGGVRVKLWHPISSTTEEVRQWRQWLVDKNIQQPFKQAHREVYVITDAELATRDYSNRFAGHILRQHQMAALARARGWNYQLMGAWDCHNIPTRFLPEWGIHIEYWADADWNGETTGAGIFHYIFTDQVRFTNGQERMDLIDVPPVVFSELMRDVDLFVGVASIGNDPEWQDRGGDNRFATYWRQYALTADLSVQSEARRELLENLLPRLGISKIAHIDGRYLVVKGKLRTYKIHIGSTNILMEPNDQYLCIVPDRRSKPMEKVFLPFEGDGGLSILLSKAFLLAKDDEITDQSIVRQITRA